MTKKNIKKFRVFLHKLTTSKKYINDKQLKKVVYLLLIKINYQKLIWYISTNTFKLESGRTVWSRNVLTFNCFLAVNLKYAETKSKNRMLRQSHAGFCGNAKRHLLYI